MKGDQESRVRLCCLEAEGDITTFNKYTSLRKGFMTWYLQQQWVIPYGSGGILCLALTEEST